MTQRDQDSEESAPSKHFPKKAKKGLWKRVKGTRDLVEYHSEDGLWLVDNEANKPPLVPESEWRGWFLYHRQDERSAWAFKSAHRTPGQAQYAAWGTDE